MQLHSCLVYNCGEKQIAGVAGGIIHYRPVVRQDETRMERLSRSRESELWGQLVDSVGSAPRGSQWIQVFDRGGDNFEAMCHIRWTGCDWVIRAAKLNRNVKHESGQTVKLEQALKRARLLGSYELQLRSRPGVKARSVRLHVSVTSVTFPRPRHYSPWLKRCGISELSMNVVIVRELDPPKGVTPICWVLLTSLPVETLEDAWQIIEDYENRRGLIEEYHKVLKTGCRIELHALRTADRLEPLIGLISVLGTRLLQLKLIGRSQPDAKAATHVPRSWLKGLQLARPKLKLTGMFGLHVFP